VEDILNNRGNSPRIFRNMLAFVAPDQDLIVSLKQEVRRYLAWSSIKNDSEVLNLDATQNRETENNLRRSNETVDSQIKETYCWLLVPYIDRNADMKTIIWDTIRISGGSESIVEKAAKKMVQNEALITKWAPALLLMELNNLLWRDTDNIQINKLWNYLCTYCYLPRLANVSVLEETIRTGLNSTEYFAFASAFNGMRYIDLKYNQHLGVIERSGLLVKTNVAKEQLQEEASREQTTGATDAGSENTSTINTIANGTQQVYEKNSSPEVKQNTHFYMSAKLDNTRIGRDVQRLVEEIINHLTSVDGCQVDISLELNAKAPDGLSQQIVRTISENCQTLRVTNFGFDDG
jgi:hypothetical protein